MKCKNCGADILNTDIFCLKCGKKIEEEKCISCGEPIREGTRFCPKCGSLYENNIKKEQDQIPITSQLETKDIPFDLIEKNIIFEAAQQVQSREYKDKYLEKHEDEEAVRNDILNKYVEPDPDDEPVEENDDDEDEEEFEYYEETHSKLISVIMILIGIIIVLGIAAIFFHYRNQVNDIENMIENEELSEYQSLGKIIIIDDVNIRNHPNTENSTVLGIASQNSEYEYYGLSADMNWYHIKYNNEDAYIYKEYAVIKEE